MENTRNNKKYEYVRKTFTWDGKRYDVKGKTIEEVYKKIAKMKVSLERGEIVINANTTVDHWFKEWVETYKNAAGLTPKSLKMYDEKYRNYIQPVIGAMDDLIRMCQRFVWCSKRCFLVPGKQELSPLTRRKI